MPHYDLDGDVGNLRVWLPSLPSARAFDLGSGIKAILQKEILPVAELVARRADIMTQMSKCRNCQRWMSLWAVTALDRNRAVEAR